MAKSGGLSPGSYATKGQKEEDPNAIEFLQVGVEIYNGYKISKDGLSREEDVAVMQGVQEEEERRNKGWRIFKKAFERDTNNGSKRTSEPE